MIAWLDTAGERVWRRWPNGNGVGNLVLPPEEALYCARRGYLTMNGRRADVRLEGYEDLSGMVALVVDFGPGGWPRPHP